MKILTSFGQQIEALTFSCEKFPKIFSGRNATGNYGTELMSILDAFCTQSQYHLQHLKHEHFDISVLPQSIANVKNLAFDNCSIALEPYEMPRYPMMQGFSVSEPDICPDLLKMFIAKYKKLKALNNCYNVGTAKFA